MMDADTKDKVQARLKRIAGQIGGIQRMVDDDRYCIDVLLQIAAVRAALGKVGQLLLESHVHTCVADAFRAGSAADRQQKIDEIMDIFTRFGAA